MHERAQKAAAKVPTAARRHAKAGAVVDPVVRNPAESFALPKKEELRAKTLRLQPSYEHGLVILKRVLKKPINKMVNEAVGEYIQRQTAQVEAELTATLKQLQAYRLADPEFTAARREFIRGEVLYGKDDPMEGRIVRSKTPTRAAVTHESKGGAEQTTPPGPALTELRRLLRG
jgi:hypothetical protein